MPQVRIQVQSPIDSLLQNLYTPAMPTPTTDQLRKALAIAEQIQKLEEEYRSIFAGSFYALPAPAPKTTKRGRKPFSAETKAKMAAAAKLRWEKNAGRTPK